MEPDRTEKITESGPVGNGAENGSGEDGEKNGTEPGETKTEVTKVSISLSWVYDKNK